MSDTTDVSGCMVKQNPSTLLGLGRWILFDHFFLLILSSSAVLDSFLLATLAMGQQETHTNNELTNYPKTNAK